MWKSAKKYILILVGAILQLFPMIYFILTEGQRPLYESFAFFPHIFISLLLSVVAAVINAMLNRRWIKEKFFYVPITLLGGGVFMLYEIYEILAAGDSSNLLLPIFVCMLLIMMYEVIQGCLHAIAGRMFS